MILKRSSKLDSIQEWHIFLVFVNAVNTAIAVYWEFYEYAMLIFFNNDAINHYTSGVHDTITDMLVCVAGGLVCLLYTSGDSMLAGFLTAYMQSQSYEKALRMGVACGSATAFNDDLAKLKQIMSYYEGLNIRSLNADESRLAEIVE